MTVGVSPAGDMDNRVSCTLGNVLRKLKFCSYCRAKSWAQGALDFALLMVNIAHLVNVIRKGPDHQHLYTATIVLIVISIILEILVAALLCVKERFDLEDLEQQRTMDVMNNILVYTTFISSILHVFIAAFIDEHHIYHHFPPHPSTVQHNCTSNTR